MKLNLWKQVLLSLLAPIMIVSAVMVYTFKHIGMIYQRVALIEMADDINLNLLELRRYEKNILLFKEKENLKIFDENLARLKKKVNDIKDQIIEEISRTNYEFLLQNLGEYEESIHSVISSVTEEQRLINDIRPLGRAIEKMSLNKELALEIRRHEKNYLIYKEQSAVDKLHSVAKKLTTVQPALTVVFGSYLKVFNSLVENESSKESSTEAIRHYAREIEKYTEEFSRKQRQEIDKTISTAKKLFILSFIFLIVTTSIVGCTISINMVKLLKTVQESFNKLAKGDFEHHISVDVNTPDEIKSFVESYNQTVKRLSEVRTELDATLETLDNVNRELFERQDELVEARKVTAMRLLASEIAHEINNPLSSLSIFLRLFYEEMPADDTKKENLTLMLKEVDRCQLILKELADFAKKEPLRLKEVDPKKLITEAIEVARRQNVEKDIKFILSFNNNMPDKIALDPVLIHQAWVNILNNACQFTPSGGNIHIHGYTEGDIMVNVVKDTGIGISQENLKRIFEPFFSTTKENGGSGLGLALTKKIIERHNGSIHVDSKIGEGTSFIIKLPINEAL